MQKVCFQTLICHLLQTGRWMAQRMVDTAGASGSEAMFFLYKLCRLCVIAFANIFVILWCLVCRSAFVVQRGSRPSGLML